MKTERVFTRGDMRRALAAAIAAFEAHMSLADYELTGRLEKSDRHDAECETELTSHGYTPCRCDERRDILEAQTSARVGSSTGTAKPTEGVTAGETALARLRSGMDELVRENLNLRGEIDRLQHLWDKCGICEENQATNAVHGDDSDGYTGPICDDCDPPRGVKAGETALMKTAVERAVDELDANTKQ